jgi:hypothetical protein
LLFAPPSKAFKRRVFDAIFTSMTNKEEIFDLIQNHPEGLDDDDISKMTGIEPRQQVQQLCTQLASVKRIRRESFDKAGKRRKIHNFPNSAAEHHSHSATHASNSVAENWRRRLSALVAATGRQEADLLEEALQLLGMKVLDESHQSARNSKPGNPRKK